MSELTAAVDEFLALERIAVTGVSRSGTAAANAIYKKLRGSGYAVFAVNPNAESIEGDPCYPDLGSIPGGVEGVVVATHPDRAPEIVEQCRQAGASCVWMHRSFGTGSVSPRAVEICREAGISVIPGGCPMMYCKPVDFGHRCMRWLLGVSGGLPRPVATTDRNEQSG